MKYGTKFLRHYTKKPWYQLLGCPLAMRFLHNYFLIRTFTTIVWSPVNIRTSISVNLTASQHRYCTVPNNDVSDDWFDRSMWPKLAYFAAIPTCETSTQLLKNFSAEKHVMWSDFCARSDSSTNKNAYVSVHCVTNLTERNKYIPIFHHIDALLFYVFMGRL